MYRTPAPRERFNPPPRRLTPMRAFRFGMRKNRWPHIILSCVLGAAIATPIRYALGWREYGVKVAILNAVVLAVVMFLIDMARGYRRAFCIRAAIRRPEVRS